MKRRAAALSLALLALVAGCWNRREIETLGFTLATGIDWDEARGEYELTEQIARPAALTKEAPGGRRQETAYWVFAARGRTIFAAARNITTGAPRKVWRGHTQILVVGEAAARRGVLPVLDFFARDGETRRLFWVLVTPGRAREILSHEPRSAPVGAQGLLEMLRARGATSTSGAVRLHDFLIALSNPVAASTGVVRLADRAAAGPSSDYFLEGTAVFRRDKLAGYLDGTETRGMLWVQGKVKSGILSVPCPGAPAEAVGLEIIHASAGIRPRWEDGRLVVTVSIREEGNLGDKLCARSFVQPEDADELQRAQEAAIRAEVLAALRRARELGADIFGFGLKVQRELPAVWQELEPDWERLFPTLPVRVEVEAKVRRQGLETGQRRPR